jgi:hypothetical protein
MNKPQPATEPSFLLDLDLEDILDQAEIDAMIRQAAKEKRAGKKLNTSAKNNDQPQPPAPRPSPWHVTEAVIVMRRTICRCGATFHAPAADIPLAHFQHKRRSDMTREVAKHPSTLNDNLPRSIRWLESRVEACPGCFLSPEQQDLSHEEETHG